MKKMNKLAVDKMQLTKFGSITDRVGRMKTVFGRHYLCKALTLVEIIYAYEH
jgi:hypothetical protein